MSELNAVITSTYRQFADFIESSMWKDMHKEISIWIAQIHEQLEVSEDDKDIHRLQGSVKACRNLLVLPEQIMEALEIEQERRDVGRE